MNTWRSVGVMAFLVIALTAVTVSATPTTAAPDRNWLRQSVQGAAVPPATTQFSLGKWAAIALLGGFGGYAVWKRKQVRRTQPKVAASSIRLGSITKLSPKAQLVVATVNGRSMLLGVTDASIHRLMWLDGQDDDVSEDDYMSPDRATRRFEQAPPDAADLYPNEPPARRTLGAQPGKAVAVVAKAVPPRRPASKFRELLADAIGLTPRVASVAVAPKAPVDELLASAEDRYVGRDTRRMNTARLGRRVSPAGPMIDVEGQAAGLVARLNRS